MPLSVSNTVTDSTGKELLVYGTDEFPIAFYLDDLDIVDTPWHWHPEFELVTVVKGSEEVSAGGVTAVLKKGDGMFVNSGVLHSAVPLESGSVQHAMVFNPYVLGDAASIYYRKYIGPLMNDHSFPSMILDHRVDWQNEILTHAETAWNAGAYDSTGSELTVRNALSFVLLELLNHSEGNRGTEDYSFRDDERIKHMLRYIELNFREEITLEQIAQSARISVSEALRCFHRTMHTTPIRYLKELRIARACGMLQNSTLKINEIAERCGFLDMSYFAKTFREVKHCTPSKYRKRSFR